MHTFDQQKIYLQLLFRVSQYLVGKSPRWKETENELALSLNAKNLQQSVNRSHEFLSQKLTTLLCRELIGIRKASCGVKDTQSRASVNTKSRGMLGRSHASPRGEVSCLRNFLPVFHTLLAPTPFLLSVSLCLPCLFREQ